MFQKKINFLMNKIYLLTTAFAVMASLSGCSDTELASIDTAQEKTPIGFHTVGSQMGSRATIITSSNLKDYSFNVYAFNRNDDGTDGTVFMGTNDQAQGNEGGVNISYNDGKWDYTTPADLKYWPTNALNFYAVSPVSEDNHNTWQISKDKKEFNVFLHNEYADPVNSAKNVDVMYAITPNQKKTTSNGGTVQMQFRHILSQVSFKAKNDIPNMEVKIKGIEIYNFYNQAYFTLPTTEVAPTQTNWKWSEGLYTSKGFTVVKDKSIDVGNTETLISMDGPMLFIPQKLNKWTTTAESPKSITQADASKESYLKISCRIKLDGSYRIGTETTFDNLYVPFGADWQPGKHYVYTLIFGGGYKQDGTPILTKINITADTEPWKEDLNEIVTQQ